MSRNMRGRRFDEPKLNMKKVFAVIIALLVVIMSIITIVNLLSNGKDVIRASDEKYYVSFKENKWGVINSLGKEIIAPAYQEMIVIPNNKKDIFLCVYDVNYETGEYKTKVLNGENKEIYTEYSKVEAISNRYKNNQMWYEEDVLSINENGKYGLIDLEGKKILPAEYTSINSIEGIQNILKIKKNGKFGVVNLEGKEILPTIYSEIDIIGSDAKSGFIVKNEQNQYGVINYSGETALDIKYEEIYKIDGNELYVVKQNGSQKLVNKTGEVLIEQGFDEIIDILENDMGIIFKLNNKLGIMNISKEVTIEAQYTKIEEVKPGILVAEKEGKTGVIDIENNIKMEFRYNNVSYNKNANIYIAENEDYTNDLLNANFELRQTGYLIEINTEKAYIELKQNDEYKYYDYTFEEKNVVDIYKENTLFISKKDGKYGFVDKNGNVKVDYIYDDVTKQNEFGFAGVKKDGKWGSVDSNGKIVQSPIYNLDNYLIINFIGRWHYGKDLNMNYYNQI